MATSFAIPVLDCSSIGLDVKEDSINSKDIKLFGDLLKTALATSGLCYLKNHGLDTMMKSYMEVSKKFFTLAVPKKQQYANSMEKTFGWVAMEREILNPGRPGDLKEAFNYIPADDYGDWPGVEDFGLHNKRVFQACAVLAKRLCDCLSVGLGLEKRFLAQAHEKMGSDGSPTCLRSLYYPPIEENTVIKPGQIRLGEHSDYGTISLVYQDDTGGLEANVPGQGFVHVAPIPDTIVVNIGDLLQRWTSDKLMATEYRVLIPEAGEASRKKSRQSVVFFVQPDDDYIISPIDGSDKYKPVSGKGYLVEKLSASFNKHA